MIFFAGILLGILLLSIITSDAAQEPIAQVQEKEPTQPIFSEPEVILNLSRDTGTVQYVMLEGSLVEVSRALKNQI